MFSNFGEIELLYAKISTEESLVSDWIVVEGAYSFRGASKPLILSQLLKSDPRFKPYLDRIHVVEVHENLILDFKYGVKYLILKRIEFFFRKLIFGINLNQKRLMLEKKYFFVENASRNAAVPKILDLSNSNNDWVLISDVDEILNLNNDLIKDSVIEIMESQDLFSLLYRQKFVFDFDNFDSQQRFTPFINVELLKRSINPKLSEFRSRFNGVPQVKHPYVSEYTFCFSLETVLEKYEMFPHVSPPKQKLLEALRINATPLYDDSNDEDIRWYKKVNILDYSVPNYIVDNLDKLKTHNIDENYKINRKIQFPGLFR
jgi:hypothetical protein